MSEKEELLKIKKRYERSLLAITGVTGVGVNGSIILYVEKVTPKLRQFVPTQLDGIKVKIVETGTIRPLAFPIVNAIYLDRTARIRPAPGGCSIGHPEITAGTLTGRLLKNEEVFGLSNNHVLNGPWGTNPGGSKGDPVLQPGVYDGGTEKDVLGSIEAYIPVKLGEPNLVDAGIFYSDELAEEVLEVGKPDQTVEPKVGMTVKKSGRSSGLTYSKLIDVDATIKVSGWGEATFTDQCVAKPALGIPGDSGSWTGSENDETVCVLFAGSQEVTILCKAKTVEELFDGQIIPPLPYISMKELAAGLLPMVALGAVLPTGPVKERRRNG